MSKMTNKEKSKEALKEDIKHLLEEIWDTEEGEMFYNIFTRESAKETHKVLRCSKEEVQQLSCREDDGSVCYLKKHQSGDVRILVHYQSHLIAKKVFPEYIETPRFNSISRKEWRSFANHPDDIALISQT